MIPYLNHDSNVQISTAISLKSLHDSSAIYVVTFLAASMPRGWRRCNQFITQIAESNNSSSLICPNCNGGFVEEINDTQLTGTSLPESIRRRFPAAAICNQFITQITDSLICPNCNGGFVEEINDTQLTGTSLPESIRRRFPAAAMFLDQLTQIEVNGLGLGLGVTDGNPPASKDAVAKMPNVVIEEKHVLTDDPHCAVCKDAFVLGTEVKEMPCQHLYHSECILPWLALRNSCPVCRHELPSDSRELDGGQVGGNGDEAVGLTIWRLPGGGFAVGRFAGGRRGGEREFPVVFTEMDGGFNNNGAPRRISWVSRVVVGGRVVVVLLGGIGCWRLRRAMEFETNWMMIKEFNLLFDRVKHTSSGYLRRNEDCKRWYLPELGFFLCLALHYHPRPSKHDTFDDNL
ncbi:zinc finger, RING/FYVE/PHD-type [Artemisia annua]|uniref:RING-type E3 ubiquitin transferase n=1 Tax=Artemisia annua TaxID=35608 RepID=A0A2U1Q2G1_ARTAN|nr:zinc finger, RING/FYVE/PHD-type [Artemisia annua]